MDFGADPPFSWSRSRHDKLRVCARRYYWHYYASWKGWDRDADDTARRAYLLKQLTSLRPELGNALHRRAFEVGFKVAQGLEPPELAELLQRTREELNRVVLSSRDREAFVRRPRDRDFLRSVWYGEGLDEDEVERVRARLEPTHRGLRGHELWEKVRAGRCSVELMDDPDVVADPRFEVEGVPVYAEPDLVLRREEDGVAVVVDWKSGRERPDDAWQLALHALSVRARTGEERFAGRAEYLSGGRTLAVEIGPAELEAAEERVRHSVGEMRSLLSDAERNRAPGREGFPLTDNRAACRWCYFYELCEPELEEQEVRQREAEGRR